ncbi:MAG: cytochrome C [Hyphomicrobium sp.]|nr:MAG: cytochrome C [Hyphomicrobium sp.]
MGGRRHHVALALWTLAIGVGPTPASADTISDVIVKGQALAVERCARCHGTGDKDPSPHASAPPFRVVAERYPVEHLAEALAEGIVSGHPDMPVFVMSPDEIHAFLSYLDSLLPPAGSTPPAGRPIPQKG